MARRLSWLLPPAVATIALVAMSAATQAAPSAGPIIGAGDPDAIAGQYLVSFKENAVQQSEVGGAATDLATRYQGTVGHVYRYALRGFSVRLDERQARKLAADSTVASVEQSHRGRALDTQPNPPSWGVDRVDQRDLPLNQRYDYPTNAGQGATVYVLDTGIRRSHQDFGTRASFGPDFVDNDNDSSDCHGHGTHVAGTAVGTSYGLAKRANVVGIRVLDCSGFGDDSDFIAAIDWVKANARKPAVVNYSIGCGSPCSSPTLDNAVRSLIASGVQWAQAAGNSNQDACGFSPQKVPEAITVGNTQQNDARNSTSSWGSCLDLLAPGTSIVSASHSSDTGSATMTGTSMASPHVAGAAALYLGANPNATPQQVRDALVTNGTNGKVTSPGTGSPNVLLYTGFIGDGGGGGTIVNGGFEAGDLSGWTPAGTTGAVNAGAHSGTYAVRLGTTTATNGVSSVAQTFTAPTNAARLSFWYSVNCPDTVFYAWAKATLTDNTTGATTTPLAKTCTNGQGWQQVTVPVTGGHGYTLTLVNRDDNHPDDPVNTLYDDVSFDAT